VKVPELGVLDEVNGHDDQGSDACGEEVMKVDKQLSML
jgi:hypothetical protein